MSLNRRSFAKQSLFMVSSVALPELMFWPTASRAATLPAEFLRPDHNYVYYLSNDAFIEVLPTVTADSVVLRAMAVGLSGEPQLNGWAPAAMADDSLKLRFWVDKPDGTRTELGVVTYPYQLVLPRSALPANGWVSLTGEVVVATSKQVTVNGTLQTAPPNANRFLSSSLYLGPGGSSKAPLPAIRILTAQYDCGNADWLSVPAKERFSIPAFTPYPLKTLPSQNNVAPLKWVKEALWGPGVHYIETISRWRRIDGVVQREALRAGSGSSELGPSTDIKKFYPVSGGPPGLAATTTFGTARGNRSSGAGPMWFEMDGQGRFWGYNRDGTIIPIAGPNMPPADLYAIPDETLSTYITIGSFPNGFAKHAHDFAFDMLDPLWIYIADTDNNRLMRLDRHAAAGAATENYASWMFSAWGAAFSKPTSIDTTADGKIYVVDSVGVWLVDRIAGNKTALLTQANLFWVRTLGNGWLCLTDSAGKIYRFDPVGKTLALLADTKQSSTWSVVSADTKGLIGPVDSVYYVNGENYETWRIDQTNDPNPGTTDSPNPNFNKGFYPTYFGNAGSGYAAHGQVQFCQDAPGHYMWNCEVHTSEPYVFVRGFANTTPWLMRPMQPSEMGGYLDQWHDSSLEGAGHLMMARGTIQGFPWGARPSFTSLMSSHGHTTLGIPMFDAIQAMPLADRIAYVRSGMGGSVPRPELVGDHLRTMLYWIWRNSRQYMAGVAFDGPPLNTDQSAPVISSIQATRSGDKVTWTWTTDKPTLCYVRFGERQPVYRWTPLENSFGTSHTAVASRASLGLSYQIVALASNGVITEGVIGTVSASTDTTPPNAPRNLR